ncbi:MAG: hypothetical protein HGA36_04915 [Candidatus Moranbacteria bacterium]|nr:hypothetical protein [Candidatus Moranbacteria bacterium]
MFDPQFQNHAREFGFIFDLLKENSYLGFFLFSIFVSYLIPIPEAVLLILFGFLAKAAGYDLEVVLLVSIAGTIIGDNILYRLSFFGNKYVERFNRKMRAHKLIQYEQLAAEHIGKAILFLRLITGVRFFGPVIAGTLGTRWKKFFFFSSVATILHSTGFILLGFHSHRKLIALIAEVEIVRNVLFFSSVLIVGILIKIFAKKK